MAVYIICFSLSFLVSYFMVQIINIAFKTHSKWNVQITALSILLIGVLPVIQFFAWDLPRPVCVFLGFMLLFGKFFMFAFIYKKIDLKFLYISLLSYVSQSYYGSVFRIFMKESDLMYTLQYVVEALIIGAIWMYIKRPENSAVFSENIRIIPNRVYIGILIFLTLMSLFLEASLRDSIHYMIKFVALPVIVLVVYIVMSVMKISVSEKEHEQVAELLEKQLDNQAEYYQKINDIYTEFRSFRHDFKNHMICLRSLLADNDIEEALSYMNNIEEISYTEKKNFDTGNIIADALLSDKSEKAKQTNAHIVFSGFIPTMGISNVDLCTIMSNAIDNAIEACEKDKTNKYKEIVINSDFKQGYFFFKAENPIFEQVHINKNKTIDTTKSNKNIHGFGIANILKVSEKYNGDTTLKVEGERFILESELLLDMSI